MNNVKQIDLESWGRYQQYLFFKDFDSPFFNLCSELEVTKLKKFCKLKNQPFFISILYESLYIANSIKEFKLRLTDDGVVEYNSIYAGSTVLNQDKNFNFCYFDYFEEFRQFSNNAKQIINSAKSNSYKFQPRESEIGLLHFSTMPWVSFTSITHARNFKNNDSIPKIVFGKFYKKKKKWYLPISIEVHHALMDGYHVGKYLKLLQNQINISY